MGKQIIATTFAGLFLKHEPWDNAHKIWFRDAAEKLKDPGISEWVKKKDYFKGVDMAMKKLYPRMNKEERTIKAREMFFESVYKYAKENPRLINREIIDYFISLKSKYKLALITTNTKEFVNKILNLIGNKKLFDLMEFSLPEEKDDKRKVFARFLKKYGKPLVYIGANKIDSYSYCKEHGILAIYANLEENEEIPGVEIVRNLEELKKRIEMLN